MRIAAVNKFLPSIKRVGLCVVRLNYEYSENCNSENNSSDKSPLIKCSICVRGFILAVEGLRTTGNSTGKSVLIAFLKNDCNYDKCSRNKKQYKKYKFKNFHYALLFILFPAVAGKMHTVILS